MRTEVVQIAITVGRELLAFYRRGRVTPEHKADGSPVTAADRHADARLHALLARWSWPVLSEETGAPPWETRRRWDRYWLVDPLDGTRDFVRRSGEFAICIALIDGDRPCLGVISAPYLGITWSAAQNEGAFRRAGTTEHRLTRPRQKGPRIALISRFHPSERQAQIQARYEIESRYRVGSAIKFGRMAEGAADLYARFGPTMEWDVAAGDLIVHEAGCVMTHADTGEKLRYNKPNLANPGFVVRSARLDAPPEIGHANAT